MSSAVELPPSTDLSKPSVSGAPGRSVHFVGGSSIPSPTPGSAEESAPVPEPAVVHGAYGGSAVDPNAKPAGAKPPPKTLVETDKVKAARRNTSILEEKVNVEVLMKLETAFREADTNKGGGTYPPDETMMMLQFGLLCTSLAHRCSFVCERMRGPARWMHV